MHLLSCEHPVRVYNKYIGEYVWTCCGKCNSCRNAKAFKWTEALERERMMHRYCMFVTLTYSDTHLPLVNVESNVGFSHTKDCFIRLSKDSVLECSRLHDSICIPFMDLLKLKMSKEEWSLFYGLYRQFGGIPYFSTSDLQYFHKRLNKWFHDNITHKYENFRYFVVSEFGSTTMRPHAHGIYYADDFRVAERFEEGVRSCWQLGINDTKYVESSACAYVAQYVNKFADLPLFYKETKLKPCYWFSKRPIIGCEDIGDIDAVSDNYPENIQKVFDNCLVETCSRRKATSTDFVVRPLNKSVENRLFPKCPYFKQVSSTLRVELYSISSRFVREGKYSFNNFFKEVLNYLQRLYDDPDWNFRLCTTELSEFLYRLFYKPYMTGSDEDARCAFGWLRRLYYLSRKVLKNMVYFHVNLLTYVNRIVEYYDKKELWLLKKFYDFQSQYDEDVEHLALMYPEYLWKSGFISVDDYCESSSIPTDVVNQIKDGAFYAFSNKKTHFKNAYLDSLGFKANYKSLFYSLKNYYHAKKCYETLETIAA